MTLDPRPTASDAVHTADPLALSARVIDSGRADEPTNRVTNSLTELADDLSIVESFSHIYSFDTGDGLVSFDATGPHTGARAVESLRRWRTDRLHSLVYTHGHIDHVGGSGAIAAEAAERGHPRPAVIGHERVVDRFHRYQATNGFNLAINARQFGGVSRRRMPGMVVEGGRPFLPEDVLWPTVTYSQRTTVSVGNTEFHLHHGKGETDDHTWAWVPRHRALCTGDFVVWVFPNAGNPQKVQRYPLEWARVLREMQSYDAELLLPAHGLPIQGPERIATVLGDMATVLEQLVSETLERMNAGQDLDEIVHGVQVPPEQLDKPWLRPVYDEPEFVVRNIWRLYGGWWGQDPAELKPAPKAALAAELAGLAGGTAALVERAHQLADAGELRLACHLIELATQASPDDLDAHGARAEIYQTRRDRELSLMAKGVYAAASAESRQRLDAAGTDTGTGTGTGTG